MSAKRRHWKEKDGRFWARIAVPKALQSILGKSELIEPLGGDRKVADRNHAAAVARLQEQIATAAVLREPVPTPPHVDTMLRAITAADEEHAVWTHYTDTLQRDEDKRAAMPTKDEIAAEHERAMQRIDAGDGGPDRHPVMIFNLSTDYELKAGARHFDENLRTRRLAALRAAVNTRDTRFIEPAVLRYVTDQKLMVEPGSAEWQDLCYKFTRAEIAALMRTLDRDNGIFNDTPPDPFVKLPTPQVEDLPPVSLTTLFQGYIASRQLLGRHRDGGANWEGVVVGLIKFLGHDDALKITKQNLLDWRDTLMASGMSPKTVSDKHIAAISAVLRWATKNNKLPTNEVATVRQDKARKVQNRERGYTTPEALKVLNASISHQPKETTNPSNRESSHITAAKRWVPMLCAFTGARVTEMTQLRKQDIRQEGGRWILRITPEAGSVKTGQYRDVPLHHQVVSLGFIDFVTKSGPGPLFHGGRTPDKYIAGSKATAGRLSAWLNDLELVPVGVQPSYGWRHRFKTLGLEKAASSRVLDGLQGHPGKTSSDDYGDVTIAARLLVIDSLPTYDLSPVDVRASAEV